MHFFFLERFLHPAEWFDKRLAYTRSVAASSMVSAFYFSMHAYFFSIGSTLDRIEVSVLFVQVKMAHSTTLT